MSLNLGDMKDSHILAKMKDSHILERMGKLPPMSWEEYSKKEPLIAAVERIAREVIHEHRKRISTTMNRPVVIGLGMLLMFLIPTAMAATWFEMNLLASMHCGEKSNYEVNYIFFEVRKHNSYDSNRPTGVYLNYTNDVRITWIQFGDFGYANILLWNGSDWRTADLLWYDFYVRGQGNITLTLADGTYLLWVFSAGRFDVKAEQYVTVTEKIAFIGDDC